MSKHIEELSKDLAGGMSRRKAFWRFFAGIGGIFLAGKTASAAPPVDICVAYCRMESSNLFEFDECVIASAFCPRGECAVIGNGRHLMCVELLPVGVPA